MMNPESPSKILLIQTAFIGDVILATAALEQLQELFPSAQLDFMVRKGNHKLLEGHPFIKNLYVWEKKEARYKSLFQILSSVRKEKYDAVINFQRFASTGFFTAFSKGKIKAGFDKNPFSWFFDRTAKHIFSQDPEHSVHETERNFTLLEAVFPIQLKGKQPSLPRLYPGKSDYKKAEEYQKEPFVTISPFSVWPTKELPVAKWVEFIDQIPFKGKIYLLGGPDEAERAENLRELCLRKENVINLAGKLGLLPSAALIQKAVINYVNDSAPLHLCSATDSRVCAVFCSTSPRFGFGPVGTFARVVEVENLNCKPCGIHGHKKCPEGHFKCGLSISVNQLNQPLLEAKEKLG